MRILGVNTCKLSTGTKAMVQHLLLRVDFLTLMFMRSFKTNGKIKSWKTCGHLSSDCQIYDFSSAAVSEQHLSTFDTRGSMREYCTRNKKPDKNRWPINSCWNDLGWRNKYVIFVCRPLNLQETVWTLSESHTSSGQANFPPSSRTKFSANVGR